MTHFSDGFNDFRPVALLNHAKIVRRGYFHEMLYFCGGKRVLGFQVHIVTKDDKPNIIQGFLFQTILLKCQKTIASFLHTLK